MANFSLRFFPAEKAGLIVSVSKKTAKKAVVRNKIKRRVRAVMREFVGNLRPGSYLIVAKPGSEKIRGQELKSELKKLFKL